MEGAVKNLERLMGKEEKNWKKMEDWKNLYQRERKWERKAREEIMIDIRKLDNDGYEEKRQEERKEEKGEVIIYSDGSKKNERAAAGISRVGKDNEVIRSISYRLEKNMEIINAEMVGIKKTIEI